MNLADELASPPSSTAVLGKIAALLERNGIEIDDIGRVAKLNLWQGFHKNDDGEAEVVDLAGISFSPTWETGPDFPTVQPARPMVARPRPRPKTTATDRTTVILPDPQIGFRRWEDGTLDPFHDEAAMDVALQIVRDAQPDAIVNLGDTCDFAEWSSKFLASPEMVMTTQPTLDRTHRWLAEQITEAPEGCEIHLLEGNHDNRLGTWVTKNAMAALRLRRANAPESWPVISLQHLLRLDELGVTYHDGYPAGSVPVARGNGMITPLVAEHGRKLSVSAVAKTERQSTVQGHIHRIQDHYETFALGKDRVIVNAWSPGCLCRVDGAVPSVRGGSDARGRPIPVVEGWQQGCAVVTETTDGYWTKEIIHIADGRAIWRGKEYTA